MEIRADVTTKNFNENMTEDLSKEIDEVSTKLKGLYRDIGKDGTMELVADFLESTPERLNEMLESLNSPDLKNLRRLAHSYRSVCQIYGLNLMSSICKDLEKSALEEDKVSSEKLLKQLKELFRAVVPVMKGNH